MSATTVTPTPTHLLTESPLRRARWAAADGIAMAHRNLLRLVHEPDEIFLGLMIPIMMALVFGYVFGSAMSTGGTVYREFLMAGIFAQTMLYGIASTATGVAIDAEKGVIDRFRSMPTARSAVVVGRSIADMVKGTADMVLLVACGLLIGWRWHEGVLSALAAVGLVLLLRIAFTWVGIFLGLVVRNPDAASLAVYPMAFPVTVLSNAFVPPDEMPTWLAVVAEWNPLSSTVAASRDLFGNPGFQADSWPAEHALLLAVAWPLLLLAVFVPLSVRRYRNLSR